MQREGRQLSTPHNEAGVDSLAAGSDPAGARTYDELTSRLRALRSRAAVSYRELHRRVVESRRTRGIAEVPARDTVHRCLQPGRTRLDVELVADIARALTGSDGEAALWRRACQLVAGQITEARIVDVTTTLPPDIDPFVGREPQVRDVMDGGSQPFAIVGMPGVGKTSLAVHIAHRLSAGRDCMSLFVNLRGFDNRQPPADPAAVLDGFLRQLGVPGDRVATMDLARRTDAYRQLLHDRPAIIVLDNASDEAQVEPLLPETPSCVTLITSRRPIKLRDVTPVALDVFSRAEAIELLGPADEFAEEIVELVGRLPLPVALMGARIKASPAWTLADHVVRLREHRASLRLEPEVERALVSSYESLPTGVQRMFRLLALHPGRQIDVYAAGALAYVDPETAVGQLRALVDAALLLARPDGYHEFHDLVLALAQHRLREEEPKSQQDDALRRLFGHYTHAVCEARGCYVPDRTFAAPDLTDLPPSSIAFIGRDDAVRWLAAERENLIAIVGSAAERGWTTVARDIPLMLAAYQWDLSLFRDAEVMGLRAHEVQAPEDQARILSGLSVTYCRTGRCMDAATSAQEALEYFRAAGDQARASVALGNLGNALFLLGRWSSAIDAWQESRLTFRELGLPGHEVLAVLDLAVGQIYLGNHDEAANLARHAIDLARKVGDESAEANALVSLGWVCERKGELDQSADHLRAAASLAHRAGNRFTEGDALNHLATTLARLDQRGAAVDHHLRALDLVRSSGDRQIELEALNDVAVTLRRQGELDESLRYAQEALTIANELGVVYQQAQAHDGLAEAHAALNGPDRAILHWKKALAIHEEIGTPDAEEIRSRLQGLHARQE